MNKKVVTIILAIISAIVAFLSYPGIGNSSDVEKSTSPTEKSAPLSGN